MRYSGILLNVKQLALWGPWFVAFAYPHGVNSPIIADFQLPVCSHWTRHSVDGVSWPYILVSAQHWSQWSRVTQRWTRPLNQPEETPVEINQRLFLSVCHQVMYFNIWTGKKVRIPTEDGNPDRELNTKSHILPWEHLSN